MSNVQVSEELKQIIDRQVAEGYAASANEYLEAAVRLYVQELEAGDTALAEAAERGLAALRDGDYITIDGPESQRTFWGGGQRAGQLPACRYARHDWRRRTPSAAGRVRFRVVPYRVTGPARTQLVEVLAKKYGLITASEVRPITKLSWKRQWKTLVQSLGARVPGQLSAFKAFGVTTFVTPEAGCPGSTGCATLGTCWSIVWMMTVWSQAWPSSVGLILQLAPRDKQSEIVRCPARPDRPDSAWMGFDRRFGDHHPERGVLTEAVRLWLYQVILFDEVEKAHEDVFNMLLQVLDDGRLTDGQGRTVDFKNTIIVLTSNLGSEILAAQPEGEPTTMVQGQVMRIVRSHFRPEFLNRLDEIILFRRLQRADMAAIVSIQLSTCASCWRIARSGWNGSCALEWLADEGYDSTYGARPSEAGDPARAAEPAGADDPGGFGAGGRDGAYLGRPGGLRINRQLAEAA